MRLATLFTGLRKSECGPAFPSSLIPIQTVTSRRRRRRRRRRSLVCDRTSGDLFQSGDRPTATELTAMATTEGGGGDGGRRRLLHLAHLFAAPRRNYLVQQTFNGRACKDRQFILSRVGGSRGIFTVSAKMSLNDSNLKTRIPCFMHICVKQ